MHGRPHGQRHGDDDQERGDVLKQIRFQPRKNAFAVGRGQCGFDAEAKQAARSERDEERGRFHFEGTRGDHEGGEGKRRRNQIEDGERDRAAVADPAADPVEPLRRHVAVETFFADLHAHPERERGAGDRSG